MGSCTEALPETGRPITLYVNPTAAHFALQGVDFMHEANQPGFEDVQPKLMKFADESFEGARKAQEGGYL